MVSKRLEETDSFASIKKKFGFSRLQVLANPITRDFKPPLSKTQFHEFNYAYSKSYNSHFHAINRLFNDQSPEPNQN